MLLHSLRTSSPFSLFELHLVPIDAINFGILAVKRDSSLFLPEISDDTEDVSSLAVLVPDLQKYRHLEALSL